MIKLILAGMLLFASCIDYELPTPGMYKVEFDEVTWEYTVTGDLFDDVFTFQDHGSLFLNTNGRGCAYWPTDTDELEWVEIGDTLIITLWKSYDTDFELTGFGKIVMKFINGNGYGEDSIIMGDDLIIHYFREMSITNL